MDLASWKLRDILEGSPLTQDAIARQLGVNQSTISNTRKGKHRPKGRYREAIDRLHQELFGGEVHPSNPLPVLISRRLTKLPSEAQGMVFVLIEDALTLAEH